MIRFLPYKEEALRWYTTNPDLPVLYFDDQTIACSTLLSQRKWKVHFNVMEVIGYSPDIPPSRHRSARILKKLKKRQLPIYGSPKVLSLNKSMADRIFSKIGVDRNSF